MLETIIAAVITGGLSLIGVVVTCLATAKKSEQNAAVAQAVMETEITALRTEVNKHNNLIERTFKLEGRMTEVEHDIRDLKAYHKPTPTN